jgi:hypothetical protein
MLVSRGKDQRMPSRAARDVQRRTARQQRQEFPDDARGLRRRCLEPKNLI